MWTLYACGFNPRQFAATKAALVHNTFPDPAEYPKMVWPTNYYHLVCQTIFVLFFAGSVYAPKARIGPKGGEMKNIQHYLQEHFIGACAHLAARVREAGLCGPVVVGWESFNEPNKGFLGYHSLAEYPADQRLKLGPTPTGWDNLRLGMGRAVTASVWSFGMFGPTRSGTETLDPAGAVVWLSPDAEEESRYGWSRDPDWKLGRCIWAQHGVWDIETDKLLKPDYFARDADGTEMTYEHFTNTHFMHFYRAYRTAIRAEAPDTIMFCQPSVFEVPPDLLSNRTDKTEDPEPNTVFAPHFYDGLTLIRKSWNRWMNVDVFGILRGRYPITALAVRVGEPAIRNCFRDQLKAMREEGVAQMGARPTVFTEIGIPFDMNDKSAYSTGDYADQVAAMDANMFALEASGAAGYTLWTYVAINSHEWGDCWNGEDLSIFSRDDAVPPCLDGPEGENPDNNNNAADGDDGDAVVSQKGYRAVEAVVRPYPIAVRGRIISHGFDLQKCVWTMTVIGADPTDVPPRTESTPDERIPSVIFLPKLHFPSSRDSGGGSTTITVSGGDLTVVEVPESEAHVRRVEWRNPDGRHTIEIRGKTVVGPVKPGGVVGGQDRAESGSDPSTPESEMESLCRPM